MIRKALTALVFSILAIPAAATQIADGSFEGQGVYAGVGYCYFETTCSSSGAWNGGSTPGQGGGAGFINENNGDWPGIQTDGTYHAFIQGAGYIAQGFLVADKAGSYQLNWAEAGRTASGYNAPHDYRVLIVRNTFADTVFSGTSEASGSFISRQSNLFTLSAGESFVVTFAGSGDGGDRTTFLDQVSLNFLGGAPGVPEPASWAMLISGFGLLGITERNRRKIARATA